MDEHAPKEAQPGSCPFCQYEATCGYSPLAMSGHRADHGNQPCVLGNMSSGKPFFQSKAAQEPLPV